MHFPVADGYKFTEKDWNTWSSVTNNPYFYSKKLAEEAAWNIYKEDSKAIELVVVNPLLVIGPSLSAGVNTSLEIVKGYLTGHVKQPFPGYAGFVDVRDVATAHVIAVEHPEAVGKRFSNFLF